MISTEKFNIFDEWINIKVFSECNYSMKEETKKLFKGYFNVDNKEIMIPIDYNIYLLSNDHNINFMDNLDEHKIFISKKDHKLYLVMKENNKEEEIIYYKRIIESLRNRILEKKGAIFFHASSISIDGNAAIFVGEKNSGKTTTMLNYLTERNGKYISNDRTALIKKDGKTIAIGSPTNIGIRAKTIESNKKLRGALPKKINENIKLDDEARMSISIRELREKLNIKDVKEAKLKWIFFIEHTKNETATIKKISYEELINQIGKQRVEGTYKKNRMLKQCIETKENDIQNIISKNVEGYYFSQDGNCSEILYEFFKKSINQEREI